MRFPTITVALGVIVIAMIFAVTNLDWTQSSLNPANRRLLNMPRATQVKELSRTVGQRCRGAEAFYMGMPPFGFIAGSAFSSLRCSDGRSFAIMVNPDSEGTTVVVDCAALAQYTRGACFRRF